MPTIASIREAIPSTIVTMTVAIPSIIDWRMSDSMAPTIKVTRISMTELSAATFPETMPFQYPMSSIGIVMRSMIPSSAKKLSIAPNTSLSKLIFHLLFLVDAASLKDRALTLNKDAGVSMSSLFPYVESWNLIEKQMPAPIYLQG